MRASPQLVLAGCNATITWLSLRPYDYLIGDEEAIPAGEEKFYCEKIVRVPGSYLTFDVGYPVPPSRGWRA
jgi:predicted O-linked N-acetylglucosamine transferase (SPINDLY family)